MNDSARENERRHAEEALRASEEKYRSFIEAIEDAYYEVDLNGNTVLCNSAFCRMLGYSTEELKGINNRCLQTPEVAAGVFQIFNEVFRTGVATNSFDWEMIRKDGGKVMGEGSVQLVRTLDGEAIGFRGILRDVTTRRQTERALRASEARFRALTNLSSDWYWEQD
ncbi:MAG: PAS domain-containing protein, partial [Noviherbaspirillum sp.]